MNNLLNSLEKMLEVLTSLHHTLDAEQEQLAAGQINSSLLQRITEDKSALLATLNFIEQMRREAEEPLGLSAPYSGQSELAPRWSAVQQYILQLRDKNLHNGLLLNQQMTWTEQALNVLRPLESQQFYGPDGRTNNAAFSNRV